MFGLIFIVNFVMVGVNDNIYLFGEIIAGLYALINVIFHIFDT